MAAPYESLCHIACQVEELLMKETKRSVSNLFDREIRSPAYPPTHADDTENERTSSGLLPTWSATARAKKSEGGPQDLWPIRF
jgi:hypothetical protein